MRTRQQAVGPPHRGSLMCRGRAGATNESIRYDNITVRGDVSVIPEPSTYVLLGLGLGALLWLWLRRQFRSAR